jgi:hypothetical protein
VQPHPYAPRSSRAAAGVPGRRDVLQHDALDFGIDACGIQVNSQEAVRRSVRDLEHQISRFLVADAQVRRLKSCPTGLALSERQALRLPNDLPHAGMAEQMRVHRSRFARPPVFRGAQRKNLDVSSRGCLFDDEPRLSAL